MGSRTYANIVCIPQEKALSLLFFSHSSGQTGAERSLHELVALLIEQYGTLCTVVLPSPGPLESKLRDSGASVIVARLPWWCTGPYDAKGPSDLLEDFVSSIPGFVDAIAPLDQINADAVISNSLVTPWGAAAAALWSKPHMWWVHEYGESDQGLRFAEPFNIILDEIERCSNYIFCNSFDVKRELFPDLDETRCDVLYQRVSLNLKNGSHGAFWNSRDSFKIGIFATLAETKGQSDAVAAVGLLRSEGIAVELLLAGSGHTSYLDKIRKQIVDLNIAGSIHTPGFLPDPHAAMNECDAVLICSKREAFGRTAQEAMMLGKPVIHAASGGLAEYIDNGVTGLSYEPNNVSALAARIKTLVMDEPFRSRLAIAGQQSALAFFVPGNFEEKFLRMALQIRKLKGKRVIPRFITRAILLSSHRTFADKCALEQRLFAAQTQLDALRNSLVNAEAEAVRHLQARNLIEQSLSAAESHNGKLRCNVMELQRALKGVQVSVETLRSEMEALQQAHVAELTKERMDYEQQLAAERARQKADDLKAANSGNALILKLQRQNEEHVRELAELKRAEWDGHLPPQLRGFWWRATDRKIRRRLARQYRKIVNSALFDAEWYLANNPDVAAAKVDPALHYLSHGAKEGRAPGPHFDGKGYLQMHRDAAAQGTNPLLHYLEYGLHEGRRIPLVTEPLQTLSSISRCFLADPDKASTSALILRDPAISQSNQNLTKQTHPLKKIIASLAVFPAFAIGHIEAAVRFSPNGDVVISGWLLHAPNVKIWIEDDNGGTYTLQHAFRVYRHDITDVESTFPKSGEAGFVIYLPNSGSASNLRLLASLSGQERLLTSSDVVALSPAPRSAAEWLFGIGTPLSDFYKRIPLVDEPVLAPLIASTPPRATNFLFASGNWATWETLELASLFLFSDAWILSNIN